MVSTWAYPIIGTQKVKRYIPHPLTPMTAHPKTPGRTVLSKPRSTSILGNPETSSPLDGLSFSFKRFSRVDYSAGATHSTVGRAATWARQTTTAAIRSSGRLLRPQKEGQVPITLDFMYIRERDSCGLCIIIYTVKGRIIGIPRSPLVSVGPFRSFGTTASPIRPSAL